MNTEKVEEVRQEFKREFGFPVPTIKESSVVLPQILNKISEYTDKMQILHGVTKEEAEVAEQMELTMYAFALMISDRIVDPKFTDAGVKFGPNQEMVDRVKKIAPHLLPIYEKYEVIDHQKEIEKAKEVENLYRSGRNN